MIRYADCQFETHSPCERCSLCNYGMDCRNNPANIIAFLRKSAALTQRELADRAEVGVRAIQKYEYGECEIGNMTLSAAVRIADALGVSNPRDLLP